MKEVLVDTNVLLSFLTDRDEGQQQQAAALFRGAADRVHALVIHSNALVEMVYVLTRIYKVDPLIAARSVSSLLEMPGVVPVAGMPWNLVLARWPQVIPSLGDAIVAAVAYEGRYDAVATFDGGLRKKLARQGSTSYWSGAGDTENS